VKVLFTEEGWEDYRSWTDGDPRTLARLNSLTEDARRNKFSGLGKPEPLKGDLAGWWSRRITGEHRLVYRIAGKPDADQRIEIVACRYHYAD
jgi:toxin YoeB